MEEKKEAKEKSNKPLGIRILLKILKIILWIALRIFIFIVVGIILAIIGAVLFYNFFPIKTAVFCVGASEKMPLQCTADSECVTGVFDMIKQEGASQQNKSGQITSGMDLISGFLNTIFKDAVYCSEGFCNVKKVRGIEEIFSSAPIQCTADEEQRTVKITPKMIFPPSTIMNIIKEFASTGKVGMPSF